MRSFALAAALGCLLPGVVHAATYKDLELWTLITLADLSLVLLVIGFVLHLAQAYYDRTLADFRLRLSGENWGLVFLAVRDGSLFLAFALGLLFINPDIMADIKLAVPFMPLGTVLLGWALVVKLAADIRENGRVAALFLALLSGALLLQFFGYTFVMEAAPDEWPVGQTGFWVALRGMRSNANPDLAMVTFYVCFPLLLVTLAALFVVGSRRLVRTEPVRRKP
ncbi:MAG: hypothetical protein GXO73_13220 [Calditrichaeota bacterium]|nr:hypothetical protein [Calditrichota bacterium]